MRNKILILGGRPIGSSEIVNEAKKRGYYTIVTDFLPISESPAKQLADESWDVSTAEIETLTHLCRANKVNAITTGVHEFNINRMIELTKMLGLPCYCKSSTWSFCDNKMAFKHLCIKNEIPVARAYDINNVHDSDFPLITKPVDGSGSRGFHICNNYSELLTAYNDAAKYSPTKTVLIENFIPYNTVIIHYTMVNGCCHYSGMSDKISVCFKNSGASVMGIQTFPSKGETTYLQTIDIKVRRMFEKSGFTEGPIWIEAFYDGNTKFIFNEMGYRFGGSLTYFPVRYFYGVDQLDLYLSSSFAKRKDIVFERRNNLKKYCIIPIHINPGKISRILGIDQVRLINNFYAIVPVHYLGDKIQEWGTAQQVFCYLHVLYNDINELKETLIQIIEKLQVLDEYGHNMLYTLFDFNQLHR